MKLKNKLIKHIRRRYSDPAQVRLDSPRQMLQIIEGIKPTYWTIGFARRFATYKRAYLLFTNLDRLAAIVNNKERPVQFIFAGKAHPNDKPGQDLIKRIVEVAAMPQFVGKIIFLQKLRHGAGAKNGTGRRCLAEHPDAAAGGFPGTSGEKCVMNGVMQFSVLDGWWVEGYKEGAGWMLPMERTFTDQRFQDELDAEMIYNTIEEQIVPKYYARGTEHPARMGWPRSKKCVADIAANFTTNRMLIDYEAFLRQTGGPPAQAERGLLPAGPRDRGYRRKISAAWDRVARWTWAREDRQGPSASAKYRFSVTVDIANLRPEDIGVEMVIARQIVGGQGVNVVRTIRLERTRTDNNPGDLCVGLHTPDETGTFDVALRIYPAIASSASHGFCIGEMGIGFRKETDKKMSIQSQDCNILKISISL